MISAQPLSSDSTLDAVVIGEIASEDLGTRVAFMVLQISRRAVRKIIDDAHRSALGEEPIDDMATNKARASRDDIDSHANPALFVLA